jgi:hypothetical protein
MSIFVAGRTGSFLRKWKLKDLRRIFGIYFMNRSPDRHGNDRSSPRPSNRHRSKPPQHRVAKLISATDPRWIRPEAPPLRKTQPPAWDSPIKDSDALSRLSSPHAIITNEDSPVTHPPPPQVQIHPCCDDTHQMFRGYVPGQYDIVSRGRMPGIVFHNDTVELLYPLPAAPDML